MLLDRAHEQALLYELLDSARRGRSASFVITGEAGIGKSCLLERAIESATDMEVTHVSGVESEMGLSFAGLHRLLCPFLGALDSLPNPQRTALRVVFGLSDGPPPDQFLIGLAALTLLTDAATAKPLLCVVDDAQWLDTESIGILAFISRRVFADHVAFLFAVRDGLDTIPAFAGLRTIPLQGLSSSSALALLNSVVTSDLDYDVAERIIEATAGNPLAIIELTEELSAQTLGLESDPFQPLHVGHRVEERFLRVVRGMPDETQLLLLVAAAEPTGEYRLVMAAAESLGVSAEAADAPATSGLITLRPSVTFRHPLIRSAVYSAALPADRRRVHLALASVCASQSSEDMHAWHLGAGTAEPDEGVAGELEASAVRARRRGGYVAESSFLTRAAELSQETDRYVQRLLGAATAAASAGLQARARTLLDRAMKEPVNELQRAYGQWLNGLFLMHEGSYGRAPQELLAAALAYEHQDRTQARIVLLDALGSVCLAGRRAEGTSPAEIAKVALSLPRTPSRTAGRMADLLLDGIATRLVVGYAESVPMLQAAIGSWAPEEIPAENVTLWCQLGTTAALELYDDEALFGWVRTIEELSRERGSIVLLRVVLYGLSTAASLAGRFADAEAYNQEAHELNAATGAPPGLNPMIDVELAGLRGLEPETREGAEFVRQMANAVGFEAAHWRGQIALSRLELGLGRYREALVAGRSMVESAPFGVTGLVLPDIVEAGARCGDLVAAQQALNQIAERALANPTPWALGLLARSGALLAFPSEAEAMYREAIGYLENTRVAFDLGRAHLLYGEWLRREHRRIDARTQLRLALGVFTSAGADGFAQRTQSELMATGERAQHRAPNKTNELTPQERQIAELAAQRVTNREIAAKLFVSAHTVDYHLRKIFNKLDISSRRELQEALRRD
jgi:DNA-binding CsgD family transcriptional regulator